MRHGSDAVETAVSTAARAIGGNHTNEPREFENPDIAWGRQARDGVNVPTKDGQRIQIAIDAAGGERTPTIVRPSLRVFVGVDVDTDIVAQTTEAGVRLITVLHGPEAPREFRFPLSLPDGLVLDALPSGGYDIVQERSGAGVGRFFAAWAYDCLFRPTGTVYELSETTIVMRVEHDTDSAYPIVADPRYGRLGQPSPNADGGSAEYLRPRMTDRWWDRTIVAATSA